MEVSQVLFCDHLAFNMKNNKEKSDLLKRLFCKYKVNFRPRNLIYNETLYHQSLSKQQHVITLLTGGEKMWLYLTKIKNENFSLLINKSILEGYQYPKIIVVNFRFAPSLYTDTLFDVELIRSGRHWQLLMGDLILFSGKKVSLPVLERFSKIHDILQNQFIADSHLQTCELKVKRVFDYDKDYLFNFIAACQYRVTGVTFHNLRRGTDVNYYFHKKYIPQHAYRVTFLDNEKHQQQELFQRQQELLDEASTPHSDKTAMSTVSPDMTPTKLKAYTFFIRKTRLPNIFILFTKEGQKFVKNSVARIDTIECAAMINKIFESSSQGLVDCLYDMTFKKWVPFQLSASTTKTTGPYHFDASSVNQDHAADFSETHFQENAFDI